MALDPISDVGPVRERHRFDVAALTRYLGEVLDVAGDLAVRQFAGGQSNPTFLVTAGERHFVLRKKPAGALLPSAHAVDREYRVLRALAATDVPVPRVHCLCEDPSVIGQSFYLMDYVPGRIFRDPRLPDLPPAERAAVYDAMNDTLARLHRVDPAAVGLGDFGRPGSYFARQIARWVKQYEASRTGDIPSFDRLIAWLPQHAPRRDETAIVHGDFRLENMVVHPTEPRVIAVLDWELATLGHPLADLGYNVMGYFTARAAPGNLVDVDSATSGIPAAADYVAAYCRRTGRVDLPDLPFYVAFSLFRSAAIVQGIAMRARLGTASADNAAEVGALARLLADAAWAVASERDRSIRPREEQR